MEYQRTIWVAIRHYRRSQQKGQVTPARSQSIRKGSGKKRSRRLIMFLQILSSFAVSVRVDNKLKGSNP